MVSKFGFYSKKLSICVLFNLTSTTNKFLLSFHMHFFQPVNFFVILMVYQVSSTPSLICLILKESNQTSAKISKRKQRQREGMGWPFLNGDLKGRIETFFEVQGNYINQKDQMSCPVSLLNKKLSQTPNQSHKNSTYKVYIEDVDGNTYSTKLHSEVETINDLIIEAVSKFNHNLSAGLPPNPDLYELYAAKNCKRDTGLPSFQKTQPIGRVGKDRFFLVCLVRDCRFLSEQSVNSIKPIQVNFEPKMKKIESGKEKPSFCICGGW